ncbi:iron reductase domain protein [Sporormia fimetaria CBS 119925]|uniref:Iron reductase domain protein n=1 Tax=Sporormia fimetaria CBS 119925 TaxID=1340428 RepID=A0A6A6V675_9PLEO|nr:iron reductase domain protein [Sporormia fimetaria CBS 119925]
MKLPTLLTPLLPLIAAQSSTPAPYTDAKSGITFNAYVNPSNGYFFGLALPENITGNTDFIATLGGRGSGWSGVSLGGGMLNKLLVVAWPSSAGGMGGAAPVVSSFRKTSQFGSPPVATGSFTQTPIANGTYTNSTHWTYTFLCSNCIQNDGTTFRASDTTASIGWALNTQAPAQRANAASSVAKHSAQGQVVFDLTKAKSGLFATWKGYTGATTGTGTVGRRFEA